MRVQVICLIECVKECDVSFCVSREGGEGLSSRAVEGLEDDSIGRGEWRRGGVKT